MNISEGVVRKALELIEASYGTWTPSQRDVADHVCRNLTEALEAAQASRDLVDEYVGGGFDYETNGGVDLGAHIRRSFRRDQRAVNAKVIAKTFAADSRDKAVLRIVSVEDFANCVMNDMLQADLDWKNESRRDCVHFDMGR